MKKLFLSLTIVASVMLAGVEAKAETTERRMPKESTIDQGYYELDASAGNYNVTLDATFEEDQVQITLDAINTERVSCGLNKLELDEDLNKVAQKRTEEGLILFGHARPNLDNLVYDEALGRSDGQKFIGDIIASEKETSGGHYQTITDKDATKCGIAILHNSNGNYCIAVVTDVEKFIGDKDSFNYVGADINTSWFWGLALQNEIEAEINFPTDNVYNPFTAYTKSTKQFKPAIVGRASFANYSSWGLDSYYNYVQNISPSNVTFESLNTDILTIDENGVMQGKKAGTATVRVTLKPQDGVTFKDFTMKSVDYSVEVLAGGIEYEEDTVPLRGTVIVPKFVPEETTPAVQPTTTVIEEQTIESKTETTTEQATTQAKKTETKKTTTTTKTTTKTDNYKPAAPLKVKASKKGKKVTVKYGSVYKATSYEIQISTSKKFKSAKSVVITGTSKTIKVKSSWTKKTMYVRVRAINGTKKGSWSSVKKIKK